MPDPDPYAPFDRCGWTVTRSRHYLTDEPDTIRVSRGDWSTHLPAADYASFDGDDAAFVGLVEHWYATAQERDGFGADDDCIVVERAGGGVIRRDGDQITITPTAEAPDA